MKKNMLRKAGFEDPFNFGFNHLKSGIDDLFNDLYGGTLLRKTDTSFTPSIEVVDKKDHIKLTAELPGVKKDDVEVTIVEGLLTVKGEKKLEKDHNTSNKYISERYYGMFERSIRLPFNATPKDVEAKFTDGLLEVSIKRPQENVESEHKIEIR